VSLGVIELAEIWEINYCCLLINFEAVLIRKLMFLRNFFEMCCYDCIFVPQSGTGTLGYALDMRLVAAFAGKAQSTS